MNHSQGDERVELRSSATACFTSSFAATTAVTESVVAIKDATSVFIMLRLSLFSSPATAFEDLNGSMLLV
jgi:hypothetical protein